MYGAACMILFEDVKSVVAFPLKSHVNHNAQYDWTRINVRPVDHEKQRENSVESSVMGLDV